MEKIYSKRILLGILILMIAFSNISADTLYAGLRCREYDFLTKPTPWMVVNACRTIAYQFPGAKPAVNWIVDSWDAFTNEEFLDYFDSNDVAVILQVEPYEVEVFNCIDDFLGEYKSHRSVIGFGIDIELYYPEENGGLGRKVTDMDVKMWRARVKAYDPQYFLMLKHFLPAWLPPTEREGILFLDNPRSAPSFDVFINGSKTYVGYREWAKNVNPYMSGIEYGSKEDKAWWRELRYPQKEIGDSCIQAGPNTKLLFWLDWDNLTESKTKVIPKVSPIKAFVRNNQIIIQHPEFSTHSNISIGLYDLNGKLLVSNTYSHETCIEMNPGKLLAKGIYLLQVSLKDRFFSNKISFY